MNEWVDSDEVRSPTSVFSSLKLKLQEAQLLLGDRATRKHAKDSRSGRGNKNLG